MHLYGLKIYLRMFIYYKNDYNFKTRKLLKSFESWER